MDIFNLSMTVEEALAIQARQIAHYSHLRSDLAEVMAKMTTAHLLTPGVRYDIQTINQHIPRGGDIENVLGIDFSGP